MNVLRPSALAYGIAFSAAFLVTLVLTPLCGMLARKVGAMDRATSSRKIHAEPTPYLGGAAMFAGLVGGVAVAWRMDAFRDVFDGAGPLLGVLVGAGIACFVGTWDDIREVSPPAKTAGLVLAGTAMYYLGAALIIVRIPFAGTVILSWDLAPLLTVIWAMGMANATNFIDGLDGLAAGIVAIASGALFLYSHRISDPADAVSVLDPSTPAPLLAIVVLGACVGFLPYNFNPARIFMGDGGALMLGVVMAGATMLVGGQTEAAVSGRTFFFYLPLVIPLVVMGVPILDTAWAIIRRTRRGLSPAHADKNHLHHRLMRLGHGHRRSVLILWTWTALLSAFVLVPVYTDRGNAVVPIGIAAAGLMLYTYLHPGVRRKDVPDIPDPG